MFMDRKFLMALGVLATVTLGAASSAAAADSGYVTANLNLRAGPGFDYPAVVTMRAGDGVTIYGCLSGWSWCDIDWRGNRGWAAGRYLQVMYQSHRRPITIYGVDLGLPFITFSVDSYWNDHYRSRGFYKQRSRFDHMPPPNGGQPGGPPPANGNPPSNGNQPQHHNKPGNNSNVGNNPDNNNPPLPKGGNKVKPLGSEGGNAPQSGKGPNGNGPQGGGNPPSTGNGPQGGGKPDHGPGCPPGQKMVNGACQ